MQTATVKWVGEQKFLASSPSGHAVAIDSDRESNKAPGPMEMVLLALGVHRDGHGHHPRKKAAKAAVAGCVVLG